jgi:2-iminobutanoate/2-iminopropanoate deaminase
MKKPIQSTQAPKPVGPYSQGIRAGNFVYVSGQGPIDPQTGAIVGDTIEEQTVQTLNNVRVILESAGASMSHVVKTTVHLSDLKYFNDFNKAYREFFSEPYPARTTVGSQLAGFHVEIDVVALVPDTE